MAHHNVFAVDLIAHPLVPEGEVWSVGSNANAVYLHPVTLQRLKDRLWAQQRTDAVITYAELMVLLSLMREEGPSC
jgi:hypothetical protein